MTDQPLTLRPFEPLPLIHFDIKRHLLCWGTAASADWPAANLKAKSAKNKHTFGKK